MCPPSRKLGFFNTISCSWLSWTRIWWWGSIYIWGAYSSWVCLTSKLDSVCDFVNLKPLDGCLFNIFYLINLLSPKCVDWLRSISVSEAFFEYKVWGAFLLVLPLEFFMHKVRARLWIGSRNWLVALNDCTDFVLLKVGLAISMSVILQRLTTSKNWTTWAAHTQTISYNRMAWTYSAAIILIKVWWSFD